MHAPNIEADEAQEPFQDLVEELRAALLSAADLDAIEPPEPLVDDILQRRTLAWLQGRRGNGKSFVALDLAGCVATGDAWHGRPVKAGHVLYLAAEGAAGMLNRVRAWEAASGRTLDGLTFLPMPVQAGERRRWGALCEVAAELMPELIVVDTQARVSVGMEENSARDMGILVQRLEELRERTGATVLVVHHEGRAGEHMRGSTALEGAAQTIVRVEKDDAQITVSCSKQKDAAEFAEFRLKLVEYGASAVLMETMGETPSLGVAQRTATAWWETFGTRPVSIQQVADAAGVGRSTAYNHARALAKSGLTARDDTGHYPKWSLSHCPTSDLDGAS